MASWRNGFVAGLVFLTGLFAFQNCSPSKAKGSNSNADSSTQLNSSGNGESYGGMTYTNRSVQTCLDGSNIRARISVQGNHALLTRSNCQEVAPSELDFSSLGLMPHNLLNLTYGERVFDELLAGNAPTGIFCRLPAGVPGQIFFAGTDQSMVGIASAVPDVILKNFEVSGSTHFPGRVLIGAYDGSGNLIRTIDSGEIQFQSVASSILMGPIPLPPPPGGQMFRGSSLDGSFIFELSIMSGLKDGHLMGEVRYKNLSSDLVFPAVVGGLDCYRQ